MTTRRRTARAALVLVVALAAGSAGGWALALAGRSTPVPVSVRPLPAGDPDAPTPLLPDDDRSPLSTDIAYVPDRVFSAGTTWRLERPEGWVRKVVDRGIRWVLPGEPDFTYSVRVVPTPGSATTEQMASGRLQAIYDSERDGTLSAVEKVGLTDRGLQVRYVQDGHLRYQRTEFLPASRGSAVSVFEVSVSGRVEDTDGLDALAEHMVASVRKG